MKKYLVALMLLFAPNCWAVSPAILGTVVDDIPCPSYYASTVLCWDGDHPSGVLNACDSAGDAVLLTDSGSDISTYGEGGSNAMKIDTLGEGVEMEQSAQQYFDETGPQTICMKIYVSAQLDADAVYLWDFADAERDDTLQGYMKGVANESVSGTYKAEGGSGSAYGLPLTYASWIVVAYSFDRPGTANGDHSANPGDQGTWADGWEDDDTELDGVSMVDSPIDLIFGSNDLEGADPGDTEYYLIDDWAIVGSYKFDCSTIF